MTKYLLLFVAVVGGLGSAAQELVTLTAPVTTANQTNVRLEQLHLNLPAQTVVLQWQLRTAAGVVLANASASYPTPAALNNCTPQVLQPSGATLLHTLNTANFTTNSLAKQAMQRLLTDCWIAAGTIAGTPE